MSLTETENKKQLCGRKQYGFCFRSARLDACEYASGVIQKK